MSNYGSGSGKTHGYTVEVRTVSGKPAVHPLDFIIDGEWRKVPYRIAHCDRTDHNHFQSGKIGEIPVFNYCHELDNLQLMNFEAAYALACQLQAQMWLGGCVQCRIVEVEVEYSFKAKERKTSEPISLFELRRNLKFDETNCDQTGG